MAMKTITPDQRVDLGEDRDWLPVIGSTRPPKEKPMSVSRNEPADRRARRRAPPSANAKASPTSISLTSEARRARRVGRDGRPGALQRPPGPAEREARRRRCRARAPGSTWTRTAARARTAARCGRAPAKKPTHLLLAELGDELAGPSPAPADELGMRRPELLGVAQELVEHPRARRRPCTTTVAEDLRDEGERLLLDLRDGLEDARSIRPTTRPTSSSGSATLSASSIASTARLMTTSWCHVVEALDERLR